MLNSKTRGAVTAAAALFVTFFGAQPSAAAQAQDAAIATPIVAAATPIDSVAVSGREWIAAGTAPVIETIDPAPAVVAIPHIPADSLQQLVGDMPIEIELSADLKCLAQAIYFEARGEPLDGQLAVAEVVINRAKSGLYPVSYCDVITQRAQFSFVRRGHIPAADESSAAWRRASAVAQIAEQDLWETQAADALFFHATYVRPGWARSKVQLAQIDTHIFYR